MSLSITTAQLAVLPPMVASSISCALTGEVSEDNAKLSTITTMPPPTPARAPMPSHRQKV